MVTILFAVVSIFVFRFRSRAALELKLLALQHQLAVLRRQRPGRPQLSSLDRLLWVLLYRIWPRVVDAMVLVKPATVVGWHRKGFRFYWRWQSGRRGRPRIGPEIRDLIRRMASRGIRGNIGNEDRGALLITPEPSHLTDFSMLLATVERSCCTLAILWPVGSSEFSHSTQKLRARVGTDRCEERSNC